MTKLIKFHQQIQKLEFRKNFAIWPKKILIHKEFSQSTTNYPFQPKLHKFSQFVHNISGLNVTAEFSFKLAEFSNKIQTQFGHEMTKELHLPPKFPLLQHLVIELM